jgi:RNA polymerase sigma-70 factor, ECF subfamily
MKQWAERLAQGDEVAFADLYDTCAGRLYAYLVIRLGCREDAADVLQETFVRLARNRTRLRQVDDIIAYTFTIARNEAARSAAKAGRERNSRRKFSDRFAQPTSNTTDAVETAECIAAALARLSDNEREVIALKIYANLTLAEIAKVTSLPQGTVATRYRSGIERLKNLLKKEFR